MSGVLQSSFGRRIRRRDLVGPFPFLLLRASVVRNTPSSLVSFAARPRLRDQWVKLSYFRAYNSIPCALGNEYESGLPANDFPGLWVKKLAALGTSSFHPPECESAPGRMMATWPPLSDASTAITALPQLALDCALFRAF